MSRNQIKRFLKSPTTRLAMIHLAIIMSLSVGCSAILYHISNRQLSRPIPPFSQSVRPRPQTDPTDQFDTQFRDAVGERLEQTRQALLIRLLWINLATVFIGAGISYFLARWSLRPIEKAMRAQIQFVSDASHELRTPLTVLQTTNEIALRKHTLSATDARILISHTIEEVKKLRDLSDMLLSLLNDPEDVVSLSPVNIQDVVDRLIASTALADEGRVRIEGDIPKVYLLTYTPYLLQIIGILIDNAMKYSPKHHPVTIAINQSGKKVAIHITDTGIGIEQDDLPHIFDRFYRADKARTSNKTPGYGLGLAIAQKLAEQIRSNISVKSELNKGSTFTVELPCLPDVH